MDLRSYERLEAGVIALSVARLSQIAAVCDGDPLALLGALSVDAPALATITADSKIFSALADRLLRLDASAAARVSYAAPSTVDRALDRLIEVLLSEPDAG